MACFHPIEAWQRVGEDRDRRIEFLEVPDSRYLQIPCGRCIGCRLVRQRTWAIRCMHEAKMHSEPSSFVTLTYGKSGPSLVPKDFTEFMYRVRYRLGPTRFTRAVSMESRDCGLIFMPSCSVEHFGMACHVERISTHRVYCLRCGHMGLVLSDRLAMILPRTWRGMFVSALAVNLLLCIIGVLTVTLARLWIVFRSLAV